jgi:hypothetical protein
LYIPPIINASLIVDVVQYCTVTLDIDECAMNTDNCEQMCVNTPGGFTCACASGFTLVNEIACGGKEKK